MKKEEHNTRPLDENVSKICNICCKSVPLSIIVEYREFGSKDPDDYFWTTCCRKCYNQGEHHV